MKYLLKYNLMVALVVSVPMVQISINAYPSSVCFSATVKRAVYSAWSTFCAFDCDLAQLVRYGMNRLWHVDATRVQCCIKPSDDCSSTVPHYTAARDYSQRQIKPCPSDDEICNSFLHGDRIQLWSYITDRYASWSNPQQIALCNYVISMFGI